MQILKRFHERIVRYGKKKYLNSNERKFSLLINLIRFQNALFTFPFGVMVLFMIIAGTKLITFDPTYLLIDLLDLFLYSFLVVYLIFQGKENKNNLYLMSGFGFLIWILCSVYYRIIFPFQLIDHYSPVTGPRNWDFYTLYPSNFIFFLGSIFFGLGFLAMLASVNKDRIETKLSVRLDDKRWIKLINSRIAFLYTFGNSFLLFLVFLDFGKQTYLFYTGMYLKLLFVPYLGFIAYTKVLHSMRYPNVNSLLRKGMLDIKELRFECFNCGNNVFLDESYCEICGVYLAQNRNQTVNQIKASSNKNPIN